ncbi:ATP-dependent endonuclease [Vibrio cholerae]|nr:AAA family ATPase [Vibrio cholerae]EJU9032464.1 AAA family ATPase [Vibrio cholerae]ELY5265021.1 AAA family ATPase [Vibrio cholerae]HDB1451168.1 AAA family ATPase [Vibrio cholerae]
MIQLNKEWPLSHVRISSVKFTNFKALKDYSVSITDTNILVGPNNAGKSTIISAFRILDVALRKAKRRKPERVPYPDGKSGFGHRVPEHQISVSLENVATDYNENDSKIEFRLSNKNKLILFFPNEGGCILFWDTNGASIQTPSKFKSEFPIDIQVVPVLGPLEHEEAFVNEDTVKNALNTHRASRHFRNYWYYFNDSWDDFSKMVSETWSGMVINKPEIDTINKKLSMFVSENRIDREVYWSGFGFQIWCQLLTHLSRAKSATLVIIDEPEIYLHPDVQRQLLNILREIDVDIILATHSVEIIGEADPSEILLINKSNHSAKRLKDIEGVQVAIESLGSTQNVTLTHLARTKKILFVEGMSDYKSIRRFAKNMGFNDLASGNDLTSFESGGFSSWEKILSFAWGVKNTIDSSLKLFAVYDRDYYCQDQIDEITKKLSAELSFSHIHNRKEMENYLLIIPVLERAFIKRIHAREQIVGSKIKIERSIKDYLIEITEKIKLDVQSQYISKRMDFNTGKGLDTSTISRKAIEDFEQLWSNLDTRMGIVPGKTTIRMLRSLIQDDYKVNLTDFQIIDEFKNTEIPEDLSNLIRKLELFRTQ